MGILLLPGSEGFFALGTTFVLSPFRTHVSYQLVARRLHTSIGLLAMHQKHVLVIERVEFEIPLAAHVILSVGNAKMIFEVLRSEEGRQADATFQWFGIFVVAHVLQALLLGCERFQTNVAHEVHLNIVSPFDVHTKLVFPPIRRITVSTFESDFHMNRFLVPVQMHIGFEGLFAERALIGSHIRVRLQVSLQTSFIFELQPA